MWKSGWSGAFLAQAACSGLRLGWDGQEGGLSARTSSLSAAAFSCAMRLNLQQFWPFKQPWGAGFLGGVRGVVARETNPLPQQRSCPCETWCLLLFSGFLWNCSWTDGMISTLFWFCFYNFWPSQLKELVSCVQHSEIIPVVCVCLKRCDIARIPAAFRRSHIKVSFYLCVKVC